MKKGLLMVLLLGAILISGCATTDFQAGNPDTDPEILSRQEQVATMIEADSDLLLQAYQTALQIEVPFRRSAAIENVAAVYTVSRRYTQAGLVVNTIPEAAMRVSALSRVSEHAWRANDREQAQAVLTDALVQSEAIEDIHDKAYAMALLGGIFGHQNNKSKAVEVLLQANEAANEVENPQQKAFDLTIIGEFLVLNEEKEKAGELLSEAYQIANHIDDTESRITALDRIAFLLEKNRQYPEALGVEENISEIITRGAAPDRIADYYLSRSQFAKAADNAARIVNPYSRAFTFAKIGRQAGEGDASTDAANVLGWAVESAQQVEDGFFRDRAYEQIGKIYCQLGQPEKAEALLSAMENDDIKAAVLQNLAWGYANLGQNGAAANVVARIENPHQQAVAHYRIGLIHLEKGRTSEAVAQLTQARSAADLIDNAHIQDVTQSKIAIAHAKAGQPLEGIAMAGEIEDTYFKETTLYNVADYYRATGEYEKAMGLAGQITDPYYKSSILTWEAKRRDFS